MHARHGHLGAIAVVARSESVSHQSRGCPCVGAAREHKVLLLISSSPAQEPSAPANDIFQFTHTWSTEPREPKIFSDQNGAHLPSKNDGGMSASPTQAAHSPGTCMSPIATLYWPEGDAIVLPRYPITAAVLKNPDCQL